ncbi:MAG: helix-turn-helix domain-containing protein [Verrucomicrobia bacterium]|nr:MAG: helix-turn-helix domain-containing protein [Verrucomicrobiota bacterium]TAE87691.1 MAG: helix-turn-helix domain-containing protein [Verrucomicrobiota bacterium]TAF25375.1 MAG: helix-turn-helix domain-containing protein [Verrucomicrobiota bacterium]TAF41162.1 MAG: helix-turn-helix domain-containing protein [Verrucomicrobiota bacterium]
MTEWFGFHYPPVEARDVASELYLTSIGRMVHAPGADYPFAGNPPDYHFEWRNGRILSDFAVVWIEKGAGELESTNLGRIGIEPGQALLLPPGTWHRYRANPATGWTERWICVNGTYLHRLRAKGLFPSTAELRNIPDPTALDAAFDHLRGLAESNSLRVSALALGLLALAVDEGGDGKTATASGDPAVDGAVDFIWAHCHRPLDVDGIARHIGMSRRMLERRFATSWPRGISQELELARVRRGRDLLAEKSLTVKEAAYAAGFGSARRFIDAHRRIHGSTPGAARYDIADTEGGPCHSGSASRCRDSR